MISYSNRVVMVATAFAISVPLEAAMHLLARAIYATHNTILPVLASVFGLLATVAAARVLAEPVGLVALPLGFAVGQGAKVAVLAISLVIRLRRTALAPTS